MNGFKKTLTALSLILLSFVGAPAASAHTEIDHTTPGDGTSVVAGAQTVAVVFTDKILDLANSSEIVIAAPDGSEVPTSCLEVKNTSLNIEAFLGTEGNYKVTWRTVAEDGHAITGNFGFTVTGTADNTDFVSCKTMAQEDTPVVVATPKAMETETQEVVSSDAARIGRWFVVGGLVVAIGVVVTISVRRRKRAASKE